MNNLTFDEIIDRVARSMARDLLERELDKLNLPLPRDSALDRHIDEILRTNPQLRDTARLRVEAKQYAVEEIYSAMGGKERGPDMTKVVDI